jgi:hypothetical protein
MIAEKVAAEVRRLLAAGEHSQRQIACLTRVSRGTVGAIAAGKRGEYSAPRHAGHPEFDEPAGPLSRCGGCGGMVRMPCRLCRIRVVKAALRQRPCVDASSEPEESLELNLREEHRTRYEQLRASRLQFQCTP